MVVCAKRAVLGAPNSEFGVPLSEIPVSRIVDRLAQPISPDKR